MSSLLENNYSHSLGPHIAQHHQQTSTIQLLKQIFFNLTGIIDVLKIILVNIVFINTITIQSEKYRSPTEANYPE